MTTLTEMLEALSPADRRQVELLTEEFRAEARTWQAAENKKRDLAAESSPPATLAEQPSDLPEKTRARPDTRASDGQLGAERP
ncbi:MAG: hypothetical protein OXC13_18140 [Caldilineaceae bacterium]|nr:hypothetical protein [Caldilineaceae bacterium]